MNPEHGEGRPGSSRRSPVLKRGVPEEMHCPTIGLVDPQLPTRTNSASNDRPAIAKRGERAGAPPSLVGRLDQPVDQRGDCRRSRSGRAERNRACPAQGPRGLSEPGNQPATNANAMIGDVDQEQPSRTRSARGGSRWPPARSHPARGPWSAGPESRWPWLVRSPGRTVERGSTGSTA